MRTNFTDDVYARACRDFTARLGRKAFTLSVGDAAEACRPLRGAVTRMEVLAAAGEAGDAIQRLSGCRPGHQLLLEGVAAFFGARNWDVLCGRMPKGSAADGSATQPLWRVFLANQVSRSRFAGTDEDAFYDRAMRFIADGAADMAWTAVSVSPSPSSAATDSLDGVTFNAEVVERSYDTDPAPFIEFGPVAFLDVRAPDAGTARAFAPARLLDLAIAERRKRAGEGEHVKYRPYTVTGRWAFPLDMLRHDAAFPASVADGELIRRLCGDMSDDGFGVDADVSINLVMCSGEPTRSRPGGRFLPNAKRWESFGWTVHGVPELDEMRAYEAHAARVEASRASGLEKLTDDEREALGLGGRQPD